MFNFVILLTLCAATSVTTAISEDDWTFSFNSSTVQLEMGSYTNVLFHTYTEASWSDEDIKIQVVSSDEEIAHSTKQFLDLPRSNNNSATFPLSFNLTATFLGYSKLNFRVVELSELNTL